MTETYNKEIGSIKKLVADYLSGAGSPKDTEEVLRRQFTDAISQKGLPAVIRSLQDTTAGAPLITIEQDGSQTGMVIRPPKSADGDRALRLGITESTAENSKDDGPGVVVYSEHDARQAAQRILEIGKKYIAGTTDAATAQKKIREELVDIDRRDLNADLSSTLERHNRQLATGHDDGTPYASRFGSDITLAPHLSVRDGDKAITMTFGHKPTVSADISAGVPTDEKIQQLLGDPAKFHKLFDKYYKDLSPNHSNRVTRDDLVADMNNINLTGEQKLVAASALAGYETLTGTPIYRDGLAIYDSSENITKNDVASFADFLDPKAKDKALTRLQQHKHGGWLSADRRWDFIGGAFFGGLLGAGLVNGYSEKAPKSVINTTAFIIGAAAVTAAAALAGGAVGSWVGNDNDTSDVSETYEATVAKLRNMIRSAHLPN